MFDIAFNSANQERCKLGLDARWVALSAPAGIEKSRHAIVVTRGQRPLTLDNLKHLRRELVQAWRAVQILDLKVALHIAEQVEVACASDRSAEAMCLKGSAQVLRASVYALSDDTHAAVAVASQALNGSPNAVVRRLARTICRLGRRHSVDDEAPYVDAEDNSARPRSCRGNLVSALDLCIDAAIAIRQLRLALANWIASEALECATRKAHKVNTAEIFALTLLARVCYEDGDLARTETIIQRITQTPKVSLPLESLIALYPLMARIAGNQGKPSLVARNLVEGERMGEERGCARLVAVCLRQHIEWLAAAGELVSARECLQRLEMLVRRQAVGSSEHRSLIAAELTQARVQMELVDKASPDAATLIRQLQRATLERGDIYGSVQIGIRLVDALHRIGEIEEASHLLLDLLRIGANAGLFQTYVDGGTGVHTLLREMHERPTAIDVDVGSLVRVIMWRRLDAPARTIGSKRKSLGGPLAARQRAVLQLIGQGRSNKQIARALNLAPETVKSYVKHIFAKLGTQTRAQSVACGAKLGLL